MSHRRAFMVDSLPRLGPYSHACEVRGTVYLSGMVPVDTSTGAAIRDDVAEATRLIFRQAAKVLAAAGLGLEHVVKTTVYLADMADFPAMNGAYAEAFTEPYPARATLGVRELPGGFPVEIEFVAVRPE